MSTASAELATCQSRESTARGRIDRVWLLGCLAA